MDLSRELLFMLGDIEFGNVGNDFIQYVNNKVDMHMHDITTLQSVSIMLEYSLIMCTCKVKFLVSPAETNMGTEEPLKKTLN